jgi:arylsulfatase A-like enzyme
VRRKFGKTTAEAETDFAIDFIERNSQSSDKPWSLHLSWGPPHDPYRDVPKEYLDLYDAETIQLRQNVTFPVMNTLSKFWDEKTLRNFLQGYYAQITFLDAQFGRLIACLEKSGELENTIVVYTSDHGDMLGSHALTHKQLPYAESCRVPLMVSWPGKITPTVTDDVVGLVDLPVTMAGLLDLQFKSSVDGFDFSGNWKKKADSQSIKPESALIMSLIPCHQAAGRGDSEWFGIKTKHYTFVINAEGRTTHLYDDVGDPFQQINLAGDPAFAKVASEIKKDMIAKAKKHGLTFKPFPEFVKEFGLTDLWNESQRYFNLPELD